MAQILVAMDQGTTSSRAVVFDAQGRVLAAQSVEFPQHFPHPGWVEHDPMDILNSQVQALRQAAAISGVNVADIAAVGLTNQRETTLLWDRETGECVYNAIVWQCRRTAEYIERLNREGMAEIIREKTGLVPDAYFSGTKLAWLLDNLHLHERAKRGELCFGTVDSFLAWHLVEGRPHVTDATNASRTMLFNLEKQDWDDELLAMLDIPRACLPRVVDTSGVIGMLDAGVLGRPIPLAAMAWRLDGTPSYAVEGSVFMGGATIQWLRDELRMIDTSAESEGLARSVKDTGGVYLVPAFTGLGAPWWDMYSRGTLVGMTRGTSRAHIVRAALEATAYQSADLMAAMVQDCSFTPTRLQVDGGGSANGFLMQFQADMMNIPVVRPRVLETTALGAALLAGLAVGVYAMPEDTAKVWHRDLSFEPQMDAARRESLTHGWHRAVERARDWIEH